MVAGTKKAVTMIEGSSKNVSEDDMVAAVRLAHESIISICKCQEELRDQVKKQPFTYVPFVPDAGLEKEVRAKYFGELEALSSLTKKKLREDAVHAIIDKAKKELDESFPEQWGSADRSLIRWMGRSSGAGYSNRASAPTAAA